MKGGISVSIVGLLVIILQLLLPDPVPEAINRLLSRDLSHFVGLEFVLKAFLFLWVVVGYILLVAGIVGTFFSYRRR
jgi:hypothetical protein